MKKQIHLIIALVACAVAGQAASAATTPTPSTSEQIAAESKRANEFLDKVFDEFIASHPQLESQLGIKTHYDQWNDISDEAAKRDLETEQENLAELKRQFPKGKLDAQTKLSCELYDFQTARDAEAYQFRLDSYPVNQMSGAHSETPTRRGSRPCRASL